MGPIRKWLVLVALMAPLAAFAQVTRKGPAETVTASSVIPSCNNRQQIWIPDDGEFAGVEYCCDGGGSGNWEFCNLNPDRVRQAHRYADAGDGLTPGTAWTGWEDAYISGRRVHFIAGYYNTTSGIDISDSMVMTGDGPSVTHIRCNLASSCIDVDTTGNNLGRVVLENFTIEHHTTTLASGDALIDVDFSPSFTINEVTCTTDGNVVSNGACLQMTVVNKGDISGLDIYGQVGQHFGTGVQSCYNIAANYGPYHFFGGTWTRVDNGITIADGGSGFCEPTILDGTKIVTTFSEDDPGDTITSDGVIAVKINDNASTVTLDGVHIEGFSTGVWVQQAEHVRLTNVTIGQFDTYGVHLVSPSSRAFTSKNVRFGNNQPDVGAWGFKIDGDHEAMIEHSTFLNIAGGKYDLTTYTGGHLVIVDPGITERYWIRDERMTVGGDDVTTPRYCWKSPDGDDCLIYDSVADNRLEWIKDFASSNFDVTASSGCYSFLGGPAEMCYNSGAIDFSSNAALHLRPDRDGSGNGGIFFWDLADTFQGIFNSTGLRVVNALDVDSLPAAPWLYTDPGGVFQSGLNTDLETVGGDLYVDASSNPELFFQIADTTAASIKVTAPDTIRWVNAAGVEMGRVVNDDWYTSDDLFVGDLTRTVGAFQHGTDSVCDIGLDYDMTSGKWFEDLDCSGTLNGAENTCCGGGGGGTPGGSDAQVQYNNGGAFGGAEVYYDDVAEELGVGVASPDADLHVSGNVLIDGSLSVAETCTGCPAATPPPDGSIRITVPNDPVTPTAEQEVTQIQSVFDATSSSTSFFQWDKTSSALVEYMRLVGNSANRRVRITAPNGLNMNSQKIIGGATPTNPTDIAIKSYVDGRTLQNVIAAGPTATSTPIFANATTAVQVGNGAAGVDYRYVFDGESSDGSVAWLEDESTFNLRPTGATYFDYPGFRSILTLNGNPTGSFDGSLSAWIVPALSFGAYYGFFGGVQDSGSSASSAFLNVGASGYNYIAGTNARTFTTTIAGQFTTEYAGANATFTTAKGIEAAAFQFASGTGSTVGTSIAAHLLDSDLSSTTNYGLLIENITAGTTDYSIYTKAGAVRFGGCPPNFTRYGSGCIQTNEQGTATWDVARQACHTSHGGRLPTAQELMIAFNGLSLTNENNNDEWVDHVSPASVCGYLDANAGTFDEAADFKTQACSTSTAYRCFVPFGGGI